MKAFGDPSSRTRHRKETHRSEGAYQCILPECGTRLVLTIAIGIVPSGSLSVRIKRRSAFQDHMKKHGIYLTKEELDAIAAASADKNTHTSRQSTFHFLPPKVPDAPYCPPLETSLPSVNKDSVAHWASPALIPTSNYQMSVPEYGEASGATDGIHDYSWPSQNGTGPSSSSFPSLPALPTYPPTHVDKIFFEDRFTGCLHPNDALSRLPSPYASVSPSLNPLLDGFVDCFGSRMRSMSSSPATSNSALDDQLGYAPLDHNALDPYLLFDTI